MVYVDFLLVVSFSRSSCSSLTLLSLCSPLSLSLSVFLSLTCTRFLSTRLFHLSTLARTSILVIYLPFWLHGISFFLFHPLFMLYTPSLLRALLNFSHQIFYFCCSDSNSFIHCIHVWRCAHRTHRQKMISCNTILHLPFVLTTTRRTSQGNLYINMRTDILLLYIYCVYCDGFSLHNFPQVMHKKEWRGDCTLLGYYDFMVYFEICYGIWRGLHESPVRSLHVSKCLWCETIEHLLLPITAYINIMK